MSSPRFTTEGPYATLNFKSGSPHLRLQLRENMQRSWIVSTPLLSLRPENILSPAATPNQRNLYPFVSTAPRVTDQSSVSVLRQFQKWDLNTSVSLKDVVGLSLKLPCGSVCEGARCWETSNFLLSLSLVFGFWKHPPISFRPPPIDLCLPAWCYQRKESMGCTCTLRSRSWIWGRSWVLMPIIDEHQMACHRGQSCTFETQHRKPILWESSLLKYQSSLFSWSGHFVLQKIVVKESHVLLSIMWKMLSWWFFPAFRRLIRELEYIQWRLSYYECLPCCWDSKLIQWVFSHVLNNSVASVDLTANMS